MTHDHTYLNQLNVTDLLDRAHRGAWNGPEAHMIRALADRLEEYADAMEIVNQLEAELAEEQRRAENWKDEAIAVQRQLDQVRG